MTDLASLQDTVATRVAEQLRAEIRGGQLQAGQPLRQNEVAARLGVSSTPVREAFQMLERLGLVVREGRRGVRVFRPSISDLVDGYEVRSALESFAARLTATLASDVHIAAMTSTVQRMHAPRVSQETFLRLNTYFHTQIAECSGNARLAQLIVAEHSATTSFVVFLGVDPSGAHDAHAEHEAILRAIVARDPEAAAVAMSAHLSTRVGALQSRLVGRADTKA